MGQKENLEKFRVHFTPQQSKALFSDGSGSRQIINLEELNGALQFMRKNNPRVGDLAVKKGYLGALQAGAYTENNVRWICSSETLRFTKV